MSLLSLSLLLISYANRATALESTSATPSPNSEEWNPPKPPSPHYKRRTRAEVGGP